MKLYSYYRSTSAWRVRIVLGYKGIAYEYAAVNIGPGAHENQSAAYGSINPFHQVPTLEHRRGDRVVRLSQSVAIAEYLEETHPEPALLPRDPELRAFVREAVELVNSGVQPLQNSSVLARVTETGGDAIEWAKGAIARGLVGLEVLAESRSGRFSVGDTPSLADVYLVPQLYNARRFGMELGDFPNLVRIDRACAELDAFIGAHPDRQPDYPKE